MEISEIQDKEQIAAFISAHSLLGSEFLASPEWLEAAGDSRYPHLFSVRNKEGRIRALFCVMPRRLAPGLSYAYSPRGPIVSNNADSQEWREILEGIAGFFLQEGFAFWRFEPSRVLPAGFLAQAVRPIQPCQTLALDLGLAEEDLLAQMHQKTRYNIRLAAKKGVLVRLAKTEEDFEAFWRLINDTKERDGFNIHSRAHYHRLFSSPAGFIKLLVAEYAGEVISAGLFCFYGNRAVYMHGASSNHQRQLMAPYLLQWEAIRLGRSLGARVYDFYGIDERRWPGVTRFKRGFGGFEFSYPGTFERPLRPLPYLIFRIVKSLRNIIWWR